MAPAPIILVPGFWLGDWAWDDVAGILSERGHRVRALTLPGLESHDADRAAIRLDDHISAIVAAVEAAGEPVVLAVHSGAGAPGYAVTDRVPDRIAHMVYVDTGPAVGALGPDFEGDEYPLPDPDVLAEEENLDGLSEDHLATFRAKAIPQPGGALRDAAELVDDARRDVPSTMICCAFSADEYRDAAEQGYAFIAGLPELRDVDWVELRTSHWPMWSRPNDLADILDRIATDAAR